MSCDVDAAVGQRATFARGIEKGCLGIPLLVPGDLSTHEFLNFDILDIARGSPENKSVAITGSDGMDRGTPGQITTEKKLKYDVTASRLLFDLVVMYGAPTSITALGAGSWLVKIRPSRLNALRAATLYLDEGGSYSAMMQFGRRCEEITISGAPNKRVEADISYEEPTGDTIADFSVAKNTNVQTPPFWTRGRRAYNASFDANESIYLTVVSVSATEVTLKAEPSTPSGATDGSGFPAVGFGGNSFSVKRARNSATDGWTIVKQSTTGLAMGVFGEGFEPFEITFGDGAPVALFTTGDIFEIPVKMRVLNKVTNKDARLSEFHRIMTLDGSIDVRVDSGTMKLTRPYKPYYANGKRLPQFVDPTDDVMVTTVFKKRLFDRLFRRFNDVGQRFTLYDAYKLGDPTIDGSGAFEGVEFFQPQVMVQAFKSGDIPNKNTLEETITFEAEQPDTDVTVPNAGFADMASFPGSTSVGINVVTTVDPSWLA